MPRPSQKVIEVEGLKDFRDGLRVMGPAYVKELRGELKQAGDIIAKGAAQFAPVGTRPKPSGVKHLDTTIKTRVNGDRVSIFSSSPYANVIHWGGKVPNYKSLSSRPKRSFTGRSKFVLKAVDVDAPRFQAALLEAVDKVARKNGWQ